MWEFRVDGLELIDANKLKRQHPHVHREYRNRLYRLLRSASSSPPPELPLKRVRIYVEMGRRRLLDIDNKFTACKPLVDVLKTPHRYSRGGAMHETLALGLFDGDTDGQHGNKGTIVAYEIRQVRTARPYLYVRVEPA